MPNEQFDILLDAIRDLAVAVRDLAPSASGRNSIPAIRAIPAINHRAVLPNSIATLLKREPAAVPPASRIAMAQPTAAPSRRSVDEADSTGTAAYGHTHATSPKPSRVRPTTEQKDKIMHHQHQHITQDGNFTVDDYIARHRRHLIPPPTVPPLEAESI